MRLLLANITIIFVFFSFIPVSWAIPQEKSDNIVRGLSYRLDPAPNYKGALGEKGTELTDGVAGSKRYLSNGQAVGWSWKTPVIVNIPLRRAQMINTVSVRAGAKTVGGVYFPAQILFYGKTEQGQLVFLGASKLLRDTDSTPNSELRNFATRFPARKITELTVLVFARAAFVFLSEIEVYHMSEKNVAKLINEHDKNSLKSTKEIILDANLRHRKAVVAMPGPRPIGPDPARRWAMPLLVSQDLNPSGVCRIRRVVPWASHAQTNALQKDITEHRQKLLAIAGGRDYAAWRITNSSTSEMRVKLTTTAPTGLTVHTQALAHAQALNMNWVPDVVTPFREIKLPARSQMTVLVEAAPKTAGRFDLQVHITCGQQTSKFTLPLIAMARNHTVPQLHGNLWAYVHQAGHKPVAQGLSCDSHFLSRFAVDTVDVHPAALFPRNGKRPTKLLRRYFSAYRNSARIHLYMGMKSRSWKWKFMELPDDAAALFLRNWWHWVETIAREEKVKGELILYPVDEPKFQHVAMLAKMRRLVDLAGVKARIYATATSKVAFLITGYVDIIQLYRPNSPMLAVLRALGMREIHGYNTRFDGKLLSIEKYYRQQGWRAYDLGLAGIGIWSIWDSTGLGDPKSGWNPFGLGRTRDYGMIYAAPDGCAWPSLRLLAWRRGIEENLILRQCERYLPKWRIEKAVADLLAGGSQRVADDILAVCAQQPGGGR